MPVISKSKFLIDLVGEEKGEIRRRVIKRLKDLKSRQALTLISDVDPQPILKRIRKDEPKLIAEDSVACNNPGEKLWVCSIPRQ